MDPRLISLNLIDQQLIWLILIARLHVASITSTAREAQVGLWELTTLIYIYMSNWQRLDEVAQDE